MNVVRRQTCVVPVIISRESFGSSGYFDERKAVA